MLQKNVPVTFFRRFQNISQIFLQIFNFVQFLPRQIQIIASEMSVSCCLFVDRSAQIEHADDPRRTEIEVLTDDLYQFRIGYFSCSECIDGNGGRMSTPIA